jgi:hypothetical protein
MDPKIVKLVSLVAAVALYVAADYLVDPGLAVHLREVAAMLFGAQGFRRAGDLEPVTGRGDA